MATSRPRGRTNRCESVATVAVCGGKDCRRRAEHAEVRRRLSAVAELADVGCLGVCSGPIVVVAPCDGHPIVVERVRSPKARRDLVRLLKGVGMSDRLRRRVVTGSKSTKAIRRARRATG